MDAFIPAGDAVETFADIDAAETILANYPSAPSVEFGGVRACYAPSLDHVQMPAKKSFNTEAGYYTTFFHEFAHSTGHASRLNRPGITDSGARFGSDVYSREELCAEFAASFLSGLCGISDDTLENSAAYIAGWSKKLRAEPDLFLKAASEGQRAAEAILGQGNAEPDAEPAAVELATAEA